MAKVWDKLSNLISGLGTSRDKASGTEYCDRSLTDADLTNAYRNAWLPRKIVEIPALDACRKWRQWSADAKQISAIEAEETRLGLRLKAREALTKARLYGGGGIIIGDGSRDPSKPLDPATIGLGGIKYLAVISRQYLTSTELDMDPASKYWLKPKMYRLATGSDQVDIHPSRVVTFIGNDHPDPQLANPWQGWGDSVLKAAWEACLNSDSTLANVASLVFESKVDVISIPGLTDKVSDSDFREAIITRMTLAATGKGINGALLLDSEETYEQKSATFSGLDAIIDRFLQVVSGAADIPTTRLLGRSPAGMNSTGEGDLRNYYDSVQAIQELEIGPEMALLDECLIRSALGARPEEVHYNWASLWQTSDIERAEIGEKIAKTIETLAKTRLIPDDALAATAVNMLTEAGLAPGLEQAVEDAPDDEDSDDDAI